ncbi:hypothetical protein A2U01_0106249 [Trifolium medium]|uniref:Uncharacterized protein n=1 Tax=Trifolium medium TaxID=97028 RepID=A0A392VDC8_9FABA|nr:hypothetical protein [Trifolium medium]
MARCAGHGITVESTTGCCAPRSLGWRVAPLKQVGEKYLLEVARRAGWVARRAHTKFKADRV